jgi:hypothetical protein
MRRTRFVAETRVVGCFRIARDVAGAMRIWSWKRIWIGDTPAAKTTGQVVPEESRERIGVRQHLRPPGNSHGIGNSSKAPAVPHPPQQNLCLSGARLYVNLSLLPRI